MCPAFLLVTEASEIWPSRFLGTCDRELSAFYSEFLVSFDFFVCFVHFVKAEKKLFESSSGFFVVV